MSYSWEEFVTKGAAGVENRGLARRTEALRSLPEDVTLKIKSEEGAEFSRV